MKKIVLGVIVILLCCVISAFKPGNLDAPQAFNYQAVVRDNGGNILPNHTIGLRISVVDSAASGAVLYTETFSPTTDQFGLFSINVGKGHVVTGNFSNINWPLNAKWLKVEVDINNGTQYALMGSSQLVSVPYALYAANSGSTLNTNTSYSPTGDTLYTGNTFIIVPGVSNANACRTDYVDTIPYTTLFPHTAANAYNVLLYGLPKFIQKNYIELDKIQQISRFRSGSGHDYSDYYETCRSMKHYFRPKTSVDWSQVKIFAPVNGTVSNIFLDGVGGYQIWITPKGMPAFLVCLFHVNCSPMLAVGDTVYAGAQIGTHTGPQTGSDVAVQITDAQGGWQYVSYFDVMSDKLFACYMAHGIATRDTMIISKAARDADTLTCNGSVFVNGGTIQNWVQVH